MFWGLIVLAVCLLGVYFYFFSKKEKSVPKNDQALNDILASETNEPKEAGKNGEEKNNLQVSKLERVLPPGIPDLERKVNFDKASPVNLKQITEISKTLKSLPASSIHWLELGLLRKLIGDYEGAILAFEYASKLNPNDYLLYSNIGNIYHYYLKNYPLAEKYLKLAIEKGGASYPATYKDLYDLYDLSYKVENPATISAAEITLLDGIAVHKDNYELIYALGDHYRKTNQKAKAKDYLTQALKIAQKDSSASQEFLSALQAEIAQIAIY